MAAESILTYKKPGFPKTSETERVFQTDIEYVGPASTISAALPAIGAAWGDYDGVATSVFFSPIEGTDQAEAFITTQENFETSGNGTLREVNYEIEWVMFQRSMLEHPVFRSGGSYALTATDIAEIEAWKNEPTPSVKATFAYYDAETDTSISLSANATKFATGLNLGQENYEDFSPVARKISSYVGGPPGTSTAGKMNTPSGIPGLPSGWEWRKSADRSIRAGGQTRWERVEEWTGAQKVLTDKDAIYF